MTDIPTIRHEAGMVWMTFSPYREVCVAADDFARIHIEHDTCGTETVFVTTKSGANWDETFGNASAKNFLEMRRSARVEAEAYRDALLRAIDAERRRYLPQTPMFPTSLMVGDKGLSPADIEAMRDDAPGPPGYVVRAPAWPDWRPIETAPHRQDVLVWRKDAGEPWVARFDTAEMLIGDNADPDEEGWVSAGGWHEDDERPTHWMPLPPGPGEGA